RVSRQSLVGLARDRRERQVPSEAERAVAGAGIVRQAQLRRESGTARAECDREGQRAGTGRRIDGELLPDPSDRPSAPGQGDVREKVDGTWARSSARALLRAGWDGTRPSNK